MNGRKIRSKESNFCTQCGVGKNPCTAPGVKVSIYHMDKIGCVILINSTDATAEGTVALNANYSACTEELGNASARVQDSLLFF